MSSLTLLVEEKKPSAFTIKLIESIGILLGFPFVKSKSWYRVPIPSNYFETIQYMSSNYELVKETLSNVKTQDIPFDVSDALFIKFKEIKLLPTIEIEEERIKNETVYDLYNLLLEIINKLNQDDSRYSCKEDNIICFVDGTKNSYIALDTACHSLRHGMLHIFVHPSPGVNPASISPSNYTLLLNDIFTRCTQHFKLSPKQFIIHDGLLLVEKEGEEKEREGEGEEDEEFTVLPSPYQDDINAIIAASISGASTSSLDIYSPLKDPRESLPSYKIKEGDEFSLIIRKLKFLIRTHQISSIFLSIDNSLWFNTSQASHSIHSWALHSQLNLDLILSQSLSFTRPFSLPDVDRSYCLLVDLEDFDMYEEEKEEEEDSKDELFSLLNEKENINNNNDENTIDNSEEFSEFITDDEAKLTILNNENYIPFNKLSLKYNNEKNIKNFNLKLKKLILKCLKYLNYGDNLVILALLPSNIPQGDFNGKFSRYNYGQNSEWNYSDRELLLNNFLLPNKLNWNDNIINFYTKRINNILKRSKILTDLSISNIKIQLYNNTNNDTNPYFGNSRVSKAELINNYMKETNSIGIMLPYEKLDLIEEYVKGYNDAIFILK